MGINLQLLVMGLWFGFLLFNFQNIVFLCFAISSMGIPILISSVSDTKDRFFCMPQSEHCVSTVKLADVSINRPSLISSISWSPSYLKSRNLFWFLVQLIPVPPFCIDLMDFPEALSKMSHIRQMSSHKSRRQESRLGRHLLRDIRQTFHSWVFLYPKTQ